LFWSRYMVSRRDNGQSTGRWPKDAQWLEVLGVPGVSRPHAALMISDRVRLDRGTEGDGCGLGAIAPGLEHLEGEAKGAGIWEAVLGVLVGETLDEAVDRWWDLVGKVVGGGQGLGAVLEQDSEGRASRAGVHRDRNRCPLLRTAR